MTPTFKPILPFVEMMATQACNLSCLGCTNYSDINHKGWVPWSQAQSEIEPWLQRVQIPDFGIFGGEPLLNPEIRHWIRGVRSLMPYAQIRFTTNGLLLDRNLDILDLIEEVGNTVLKITVHVDNARIKNTVDHIFKRFNWRPITEFGIDRYTTDNGIRLQINQPDVFWKTFQGPYSDMRPHDNDPVHAFEICCQKTCPLLYRGRLYKCSTVGLLHDILSRFNNPNLELWQPYLTDGITAHCQDRDLKLFLQNFGHAHRICRQCPSKKDLHSRIQHPLRVNQKKIRT